MAGISGNWRAIAATFFSAALIVGAYVLADGVASPTVAQASTETALLQALATKDSNGDGLPDWEKVLYGINPNSTTTDYFHLGMTDGQAVARGLIVPKAIADIPIATSSTSSATSSSFDSSLPPASASGTLTAAFAKSFFTLYLAAKQANGGGALSQSDITNISNEVLKQLATAVTITPDFKSEQDLTISSDSSPGALETFAALAEAVLKANTSNATTSEINYLQYAIQGHDTSAFSHIASIAKAYRDAAAGLAALPVPEVLASTDLSLINTMARLSEIIDDFTRANTDPLATMLALDQYPQVVQALSTAFVDVGNIYASAGVVMQAGTPGASFVNLITSMEASQKAQAASQP